MDLKWAFIMIGTIMSVSILSVVLTDYQKGQCRVASVQAGRSAEDIAKICK